MNKPNFFIVGAPKCGTTAMNDYLNQHPEIFMADKELHYFGSDLKIKDRITDAEYIQCFSNSGEQKIVGEASVWYLFSKNAAKEIKEFAPGAKILIMLRNPVDVLHSLHSQHLYDGNEDVLDFEKALSLDEDRRAGKKLPLSVGFTHLPGYLDSVLFYGQVKRYLDVFGRENVAIILYDDFIANTRQVVTNTFQFLGVSNSINIQIKVINANKQVKSLYLHRLIKSPSRIVKALVRVTIPVKSWRHTIMAKLLKSNIEIRKRKEINDQLKLKLKHLLTNDIDRLSKLINRDLSDWQS